MVTLAYVLLWVLPSVLLAVGVGFYLGRALVKHERKATLRVLMGVLECADRLTSDVDTHNSELRDVKQSVAKLVVGGELEAVQRMLVDKIATVIHSNQRLEDDLICARYTLEEQAQELDRTRREARTDALSGVANRKSFEETLQYWLSKANRRGERFGLLLVDIDHFKWINDTHGHAAGDRVVGNVGRFLRDVLRPTDYVARYGGDEFGVLLACEQITEAARVAERIRVEAELCNFDVGQQGERIAVTFSVGVTVYEPGESTDVFLARADAALYKSKRGGRNQINWAAPGPAEEAPCGERTPGQAVV